MSHEKKIPWRVLGVMVALLAAGTATARAQAVNGTPDNYLVTVEEFALCKTQTCTGTDKVALISSPRQFDIANFNKGATQALVDSGTTVPPGTYSHFRFVLGSTMQVRGQVNVTAPASAGGGTYTCATPQTPETPADLDGDGTAGTQTDTTLNGLVVAGDPVPAGTAITAAPVTFTIPDGTYGSVQISGGKMVIMAAIPGGGAKVEPGTKLPSLNLLFNMDQGLFTWFGRDAKCRFALGAPIITLTADGQQVVQINLLQQFQQFFP